jgi:hypothetical protein
MNQTTLKTIINNNGGTISRSGKITHFKNGYQVSKKDYYILSINNLDDVLQKINETVSGLKNNEFCGIWIHRKKVYIDISIFIDDLETAKNFGNLNSQKSIYDWKNTNCIYLK